MAMTAARTVDEFVLDPIGKWVVIETTLLWCESSTLCGTVCWGRPDAQQSAASMRAHEAYRQLDQFDVITDGSAIEAIEPESLFVVVAWAQRELAELHRRVRRQIGVVPRGLDGFALAGVAPQLGQPYAIELVHETREAFLRALPVGGEALADEVAALVANARATLPLLVALRALLRAQSSRLTLKDAASELAVSSRQLQRELIKAGSSFRAEVLDARFDCATRLLAETDDKIVAIAAQLGITKTSLSTLVRTRTGQRATDYRTELQRRRSPA